MVESWSTFSVYFSNNQVLYLLVKSPLLALFFYIIMAMAMAARQSRHFSFHPSSAVIYDGCIQTRYVWNRTSSMEAPECDIHMEHYRRMVAPV